MAAPLVSILRNSSPRWPRQHRRRSGASSGRTPPVSALRSPANCLLEPHAPVDAPGFDDEVGDARVVGYVRGVRAGARRIDDRLQRPPADRAVERDTKRARAWSALVRALPRELE